MKVLHINSNYLYSTLFEKMIEKINIAEHKIYSPINGLNDFVIQPKDNVFYPVAFNKRDKFIFMRKQKKLISALYKEIDVTNFSLIHAHTLFTDGNIAYELNKKYNIPYIVAVRNTDINMFFKYRLNLRKLGINILKNAEKIIFISQNYYDILYKKYIPSKYQSILSQKSEVIPNGIDDYWFENKYKDREINKNNLKVNIVYAGKINKNKNIEITIEALDILQKEGYDVEFNIAGKIEQRKISKLFKDKKFIKYHGILEKEMLLKKYRENDIFIMPSFFETFGLVYAEAMSQGLPVIYTKNQGFDKQFSEGVVGYHVNPSDAKSISENIKLILNNYKDISENCYNHVNKFDWNIISKKYTEIYLEVRK